jgi:hypothetical protein
MEAPINPFDSLYVTETIDPESFVSVFSPFIAHDTSSLFQPGNVVLVGTQGSGKSMLLSLLKPETRVAYAMAGKQFPISPEGTGRFIGAGVNLTRSGAIDFGQRPTSEGEDADEAAAFFGDFLNYWIVDDLIKTLKTLIACRPAAEGAGVASDAASKMDEFAIALACERCWLGSLEGATSIDEIVSRLQNRITDYRNFFNYNSSNVSPEIEGHKTSAGEPISVTAGLLRTTGLIDQDVNLFVRVDQYEELERLDEWQERQYAAGFAAVIHKMLGLRDPRVSYRIGTRKHAWPERPRMQGTTAVLEELRNFKIIDLDDILMPSEHRRTFPKFAEDVFRRRLSWAGYRVEDAQNGLIRRVFGASPRPAERADMYVRSRTYSPRGGDWPDEINERLEELARKSPLDCVLAEAYLRQQEVRDVSMFDDEPWLSRTWWRKERTAQALLQLAARQRQRMIWCGAEDVLALSGANILVFVSLCQSIWDAYLREENEPSATATLPSISNQLVQDAGIYEAARYWHRKVRTDPDGDSRLRVVDYIGQMFREWMRRDLSMSYPGHNGFSIDGAELRMDEELREFLGQAASYGVLVYRAHSTRNRGGSRRHKWYLAPIYSPYFQIPASHVKEPKYVKTAEVRRWLAAAQVPRFLSKESARRGHQAPQEQLFPPDSA